MRTFITIVVTVIATAFAFFVIAERRPQWLVRLQYDKNGFPVLRFKNDKFILKGKTYMFDGDVWVEQFPENPKDGDTYIKDDGSAWVFNAAASTWGIIINPDESSAERYSGAGSSANRVIRVEFNRDLTNCPDYTEKFPVSQSTNEIVFQNVPNLKCPPCIMYAGQKYFLQSFNSLFPDRCYYKK